MLINQIDLFKAMLQVLTIFICLSTTLSQFVPPNFAPYDINNRQPPLNNRFPPVQAKYPFEPPYKFPSRSTNPSFQEIESRTHEPEHKVYNHPPVQDNQFVWKDEDRFKAMRDGEGNYVSPTTVDNLEREDEDRNKDKERDESQPRFQEKLVDEEEEEEEEDRKPTHPKLHHHSKATHHKSSHSHRNKHSHHKDISKEERFTEELPTPIRTPTDKPRFTTHKKSKIKHKSKHKTHKSDTDNSNGDETENENENEDDNDNNTNKSKKPYNEHCIPVDGETCPESPEVEEALKQFKTKSEKIEEEQDWIRKVEDIVKEYQLKMRNVNLSIMEQKKDLVSTKKQIEVMKKREKEKRLQEELKLALDALQSLETTGVQLNNKISHLSRTKFNLQSTISRIQKSLHMDGLDQSPPIANSLSKINQIGSEMRFKQKAPAQDASSLIKNLVDLLQKNLKRPTDKAQPSPATNEKLDSSQFAETLSKIRRREMSI